MERTRIILRNVGGARAREKVIMPNDKHLILRIPDAERYM